MLYHRTILLPGLEYETVCLMQEVKQDNLVALSGLKKIVKCRSEVKEYLWAAFYQKVVIAVLSAMM